MAGLGKALLASGADEDLETYIEHARKRSLPSSAFDQEAFRALIALARSAAVQLRRRRVITRCAQSSGGDGGVGWLSTLRAQSDWTDRPLHLRADRSCVPEILAVARELTIQFGGEANPGLEAVA